MRTLILLFAVVALSLFSGEANNGLKPIDEGKPYVKPERRSMRDELTGISIEDIKDIKAAIEHSKITGDISDIALLELNLSQNALKDYLKWTPAEMLEKYKLTQEAYYIRGKSVALKMCIYRVIINWTAAATDDKDFVKRMVFMLSPPMNNGKQADLGHHNPGSHLYDLRRYIHAFCVAQGKDLPELHILIAQELIASGIKSSELIELSKQKIK